MKKVSLDIVLMNEAVPGYAFFTIGFQTRKYLYVRIIEGQISKENIPEKIYMRVKKSDTQIADVISLVKFDVDREICVSYDEGLMDERLEILKDRQAIKKVDEIASWYEAEYLKAVM